MPTLLGTAIGWGVGFGLGIWFVFSPAGSNPVANFLLVFVVSMFGGLLGMLVGDQFEKRV